MTYTFRLEPTVTLVVALGYATIKTTGLRADQILGVELATRTLFMPRLPNMESRKSGTESRDRIQGIHHVSCYPKIR